ncbi:MAG: glycosyltransferase family 39 protein [Chloroflexi bacterium]|nr:glycosyltransferase family 39 protein [Chloroflexota bacterium]
MTLPRLRLLLVAAYLILGLTYSVVTPLFEASDELWHYPMVKTLADNSLSLPVQTPGEATLWRQEGSQPPLYYMLAAVLTGGIPTDDLEHVRRLNPHADIGVVHPDGNINMIVHRPAEESFPWRGTILAVHLARLLSVALGVGTVLVTFSLARRLFPDRPEVIVGATALNAFLPMFLFISGSVNNDNLSNLLGNLLTLQVVMLLMSDQTPDWRTYLALGLTSGAGMLAKFNIGFMLPVIALTLFLLSIRQRSIRPLLVGGIIAGGLTVAIGGWWYLRNLQLYDDPTGLSTFLDIVGRRAIPANLAQLWAERHSFMQAFWGFFGGVNLPLPDWVYAVFDAIGLTGMMGAVAFVVVRIARGRLGAEKVWRALPYAVTLLWIAVNFVSYLRWTSETQASQGRLMFGSLSSILIWVAVGLTWWLPKRFRGPAMGVAGLWFAGVAAAAPLIVIQPAYALPSEIMPPSSEASAIFSAPAGSGRLLLHHAEVISEAAAPDEYVSLALTWEVEAPFDENWSLFLHLITADDVIIAQRDIYPGNGRLALSDLPTGRAWEERLAVRVPPNAYAPQTVGIVAGWYNLTTGERLMATSEGTTLASAGETMVRLGETQIVPRASGFDVPNPTGINFGRLIELVGYAISDLSPAAGGTTELTLYWRALQPVTQDYIVFAHVVDPATTALYASSDAQPADWTRPTTSWAVGEVVQDTHPLTLHPNTPIAPGIYEVEIGLYLNPGDGTFPRLRVVTADGGMASDYAYLSRVRVLPAEVEP